MRKTHIGAIEDKTAVDRRTTIEGIRRRLPVGLRGLLVGVDLVKIFVTALKEDEQPE
jgi:hypothetical protein